MDEERCGDWLRLGAKVECFCGLKKGHDGPHEASTSSTQGKTIDVNVSWKVTERVGQELN